MIRGRCECGDIQFEISGDIVDYSHCHCSQCRRLSGAAYGTFAGVKRQDFRYVAGESGLGYFDSSTVNTRVFCKRCGSNILVIPNNEPDMFYVCMGVIDGMPETPPVYHIYVGSKAPWHEILDDAPQHEEAPS